MSRYRTNDLHITSPSGIWSEEQLIGAYVKIKSSEVIGGSVFGIDSDTEYTIKNINLRLDIDTGKTYTVIHLNEKLGEFSWKDLEIVGLDVSKYCKRLVKYKIVDNKGRALIKEELVEHSIGDLPHVLDEKPECIYYYYKNKIEKDTKEIKVLVDFSYTRLFYDRGIKLFDRFGEDRYLVYEDNKFVHRYYTDQVLYFEGNPYSFIIRDNRGSVLNVVDNKPCFSSNSKTYFELVANKFDSDNNYFVIKKLGENLYLDPYHSEFISSLDDINRIGLITYKY